MKRAIVLSLAVIMPAFADPIQEVRDAEIAFAKAFADRDRETFFSFVANDATFLSALTTARGKEAVVKRWSRFFDSPQAPFSWGPERVSVSADGTLGLSTGPVYDPEGNHVGDYISTWRKQSDGSWKIVFDSNGPGAAVLPEHMPPFEEGYVAADDGLKLYYRKIGRGPLTLIVPLDYLLHKPMRQFSDIATVITYDLRNRGKSERAKDLSTSTIQHDVRDLEAVRRQLKVETFVPVGFSYLGLMVMLYTLEHPQRVARVVQLGPAPYRQMPRPSMADARIPAEAQKRLDELNAAGAMETSPREYCEAYSQVFRYVLVGDPKNADKTVSSACTLENEWPKNLFPHFGKVFESIESLELAPEKLRNVKVPVLTIHGTKDRNAPYASAVEWVKALPNARLVTVEGAGHAMWVEDPVTTFGSIRHFLRGE